MSDPSYEERQRQILRGATSRHKPQASITPSVVSEEERTARVKLKAQKKPKTKVRLEDTGTVRTDRFLF